MEYKVDIQEKPYNKNVLLSPSEPTIPVDTKFTAVITYLKKDQSIRETVEYGYRTPEEIQKVLDSHGDLDLNGCYVGNVSFNKCTIQSLTADKAFFESNVEFENAKFTGKVSLRRVTFMNYADFQDADFKDVVDFSYSTFFNGAYFFRTSFDSNVLFSGATFNSTVDFGSSNFAEEASFLSTHFNGRVVFGCVRFEKEADFRGATFYDETEFIDCFVKYLIDFRYATFTSYTELDFNECRELLLDECIIKKSVSVSCIRGFYYFSICKCRNEGGFAIPFNANLISAIMKNRSFEYDGHEMVERLTPCKKTDYFELSGEFNFLKVNYNRNGEYEYEDQAYIEYRRCLRKSKKPSIARGFDYLVDKISCYCTDPLRVLMVAFFAIFAFAGIYYLSIILPNVPDAITYGINYHGIRGCLYHSLITFFTIGYGDSQPIGNLGLILTGLEGFIGVFLMSLFTVSFVRKALR